MIKLPKLFYKEKNIILSKNLNYYLLIYVILYVLNNNCFQF